LIGTVGDNGFCVRAREENREENRELRRELGNENRKEGIPILNSDFIDYITDDVDSSINLSA